MSVSMVEVHTKNTMELVVRIENMHWLPMRNVKVNLVTGEIETENHNIFRGFAEVVDVGRVKARDYAEFPSSAVISNSPIIRGVIYVGVDYRMPIYWKLFTIKKTFYALPQADGSSKWLGS